MAYIYEYIRTRGYQPMHFDEHFARLSALSNDIFNSPICITSDALKELIQSILQCEGYSPHTINGVYVRCYDNGEITVDAIEIIYNNFALRAIRPQGFVCRLSGDFLTKNTSAKEAMLELNHSMSQISDAQVPIWIDEQERIVAIDGSPIAAIFDDEIRFSSSGEGVEFDFAMRHISAHGRKVTKGMIMLDDLTSAKEIIYIDYRGITALAKWNERHYMDITAERMASQIAKAEQ